MVMKRHFLFTAERQGMYISALLFCALLSSFACGLENATGPNGSNVQAVWTAGTGYTGQGISVGLISQDHARLRHEAFTGINPDDNWYDATGNNTYVPSWHDTPVGGIICSRGGAMYPNDKGTAPGAELYSVKVTDSGSVTSAWIADALKYLAGLDQEHPIEKCQVVVTGIQLPSSVATPNGDSFWSLIYDYYAYQYNMVFATAAGNFTTTVTTFGDTYNSITTGGLFIDANDIYHQVGSGSNSGVTVDGRRKPDIVAPSQLQWVPFYTADDAWIYIKDYNPTYDDRGQTSWAVPHTGGVAAVLLSYANSPESSEADDNQNVVIKAVIVNSAFPNINDKSGSSTVEQLEAEPNWPWNKDRGYGRIDAKRAYEILSSPKIIPSSPTTNSKGWAYDAVGPGQQDNFTPQGTKNERLVVTLTWNRKIVWNDQKGGPGRGIIEDGELIPYLANLDLEIRDPDGILISPPASAIDNLEKYDLLLTKTGNYEIRVVNQSDDESAYYAVAFELLEPLEADFNTDYVVNDLDLAYFSQHWLDSDCWNPSQPCYEYNLNFNDASINFSDFSIFAQQWLTYDNRYYSP